MRTISPKSVFSALRRRRNKWLFSGWNKVALDDPATIAVYPNLGLVLNRIKKSGNTTITAFLADLERPGQTYEDARAYKRSQPHLLDLGLADGLRARHFPTVTFVRNPYARILSAFRDKVGSGRNAIHQAVPGFAQDDPQGYLAFLQYLDTGGLYENRHWWPQADLLARPVEELAMVGQLERIVDDMARVLTLVDRDPAPAQKLAQVHTVSRHSTGSQSRLGVYYDNAHAVDLVRRLYERDFALFGYDADVRPR